MNYTKEAKEIHYGQGKNYFVKVKSNYLPFSVNVHKFKDLEEANDTLQKFIRILEKKFDTIWYIGADFIDDEICERFLFHHGGFMEISLRGEISAFFLENHVEEFKKALFYATANLGSKGGALRVLREAKSGQSLINLKDSLMRVKQEEK